jgi:hypothetical protein
LAPASPFRIETVKGGAVLSPASYSRYDSYAAAINGLDARGTAELYSTLKPRINDAYRRLGHPEGDFDPVLEAAIAELLATPVVTGTISLEPRSVSYAFADEKLEALSPAQKQFLRMGPKNMTIVKAKLREIATHLGMSVGPA